MTKALKPQSTEDALPMVRKRPYLEEAIANLAALDQRLQNGEDPTSALIELFDQARVDVAEGIDRRRGYAKALSISMAAAKSEINDLKAWHEKLESWMELLKERTKAAMLALPGVTFRDTKGRKTWIQNSTPSLKVKPTLAEKTVRNVIDWQEAEFFGIAQKYWKQVSYIVLDKEAVKADLKAGVQLPWAEITQGQHVGGLLPKEEKVDDV